MIIELVHGFPIYMAYKSRISRKVGKETANSTLQTGLLACTTREANKIFKLINLNFSGQNYIEKIL